MMQISKTDILGKKWQPSINLWKVYVQNYRLKPARNYVVVTFDILKRFSETILQK